MRPTADQDPSHTDLAAFALGKLDRSAVAWVGGHLADCSTCRNMVEQTPTDSLLQLLKEAGAGRAAAASDTGPWVSGTDTGGAFSPPAASIDPDDVPLALRDHPRYRIMSQLGAGGMGVVYRAEHRVMERLVAVKVINRAFVAHPEAIERFNREVRAAAKLDHPNIVKAYDAEQAGDLQLLAMEYVEGKSLADVLHKKGPLPIANACHYVRQAALGLQHAHERGMVHRDLKPQNLMLTPKGVVKILDFGLAKLASESARPGGGLTQDHMVMGTPEYMAPEQAVSTKTADIRADIYALGCTLYCLLTGRPPFAGDPLAIIVAHSTDAAATVESLRPEVPAALAALLQRMLAKKPNDRPQTPKEVADALAPFVKPAKSRAAAVPVVLEGPTAGTAVAHNRRWLIPAAVAAGALLTAIVMATVIWVKTSAGYVRVEAPDGAEIRVDGEVITAQPYRITVDKKERKLVILKDGAEIHSESISIKDNGRTIVATLVAAQPAVVPPEPVPAPMQPAIAANDSFVPLFNGKDLTGWKTHPSQPGKWRVEKGILIGSGPASSYLYSERDDYKDFRLRVEARINDGGNSGLFFRTPFGPGRPANNPRLPLGYEAQINSIHSDSHKTGSLFAGDAGAVVTVEESPVPAGEWFTEEVIAVGNHLVVKVNGKTTADYTDDERLFTSGHLALQQLNPQTVAEFRKIEIKELPPTDNKPAALVTPADTRVYELRTYTVAPGKLDALIARFRDHTCKLFEKHGITSVGYWLPVDNTENQFIYLLAHASRAAADQSWTAFTADPEWQKARNASEVNGTLVTKKVNQFLTPTDYSPTVSPCLPGDERIFELRTYTATPGMLTDLNARFRNHTLKLFERHGMTNVGYWTPMKGEKGSDNTLVYLLAHKDGDAAKKSWTEFRTDADWVAAKKASEEKAGGALTLPDGVKSEYLKPAAVLLRNAQMKAPTATGGFVPLFNGKDLTGWRKHDSQPGNWRVENGILIGSAGPDAVSHLYTVRGDYTDFHLRLEARINDDGFSTGGYFRAPFGPTLPRNQQKPESPSNKLTWVSGYNAKIDARRLGGLLIDGNSQLHRTLEIVLRPGEWITYEIIAEGNHFVIKVNDLTTSDYTDEQRRYTRGHIVLQQHGEKTVAEFRKIEVKELP